MELLTEQIPAGRVVLLEHLLLLGSVFCRRASLMAKHRIRPPALQNLLVLAIKYLFELVFGKLLCLLILPSPGNKIVCRNIDLCRLVDVRPRTHSDVANGELGVVWDEGHTHSGILQGNNGTSHGAVLANLDFLTDL